MESMATLATAGEHDKCRTRIRLLSPLSWSTRPTNDLNSTPLSFGLKACSLLRGLSWPAAFACDALSPLFVEPDSGAAAFLKVALQCSRDERET
jgi:hypothetical protein